MTDDSTHLREVARTAALIRRLIVILAVAGLVCLIGFYAYRSDTRSVSAYECSEQAMDSADSVAALRACAAE